VEAGPGTNYAKAPGLRDVIQTVFGWTDSPAVRIGPQSDAVEPLRGESRRVVAFQRHEQIQSRTSQLLASSIG
jgi:hypothetical protein